jgi:hypothetical protein
MNAEATETHSSVRCIFCAQPIPLSPKLASLYVVAKDESHRAEHEHKSGVMLLRCAKCSREAPYRRDDVTTSFPDANSPQNAPKAFRRAAAS